MIAMTDVTESKKEKTEYGDFNRERDGDFGMN